jgi:hypothetical protein
MRITEGILVNRNRGTCYKQMNGGRNKSRGIPHCQDCVCVRALSGWLLHATTRSHAHAAYNLLLPRPTVLVSDILVSYLSSRSISIKVKFSRFRVSQ